MLRSHDDSPGVRGVSPDEKKRRLHGKYMWKRKVLSLE